jgi:hypothetical protein
MADRGEQVISRMDAPPNEEAKAASTSKLQVASKERLCCRKCLREFKSKSGLWKHRRKHKMEDPEEGKKPANAFYRGGDSRHPQRHFQTTFGDCKATFEVGGSLKLKAHFWIFLHSKNFQHQFNGYGRQSTGS